MVGETVTLTRHEAALAAQVGVRRELEALERGRVHRHGFQGSGWGVHIEGAGAELAVAKRFGRYWEAVVDDPAELAGDVGRAQVRSTSRENGSLILHPDDPDDAPFFLVIGQIPTFRIAGWIQGGEGKQPRFCSRRRTSTTVRVRRSRRVFTGTSFVFAFFLLGTGSLLLRLAKGGASSAAPCATPTAIPAEAAYRPITRSRSRR